MFHFAPDTQYLLITVILMEAKQYAPIERAGLFVICDIGSGNAPLLEADGDRWRGEMRPFDSGISMA
jgi:hypothetical protein